MKPIIRVAVEKDLVAILKIVNFYIKTSASNYSYDQQDLKTQTEWFQKKQLHNYPVLVAEFDHQVIGFGTYDKFREKIGYQFTVEHSVYVDEVYQNKGVGKLLLESLISDAKNRGFHTMIGCIDAGNKESILFHKKHGFEVCGTINEVGYKFDQWLNLVLMQLML